MEKTRKGALQFDLSFSKDGGFCEIFHKCTAALGLQGQNWSPA